MPAIGLGTFGSDHVSADEEAEAVKGAASVGYLWSAIIQYAPIRAYE
jgi:hypothetical protein